MVSPPCHMAGETPWSSSRRWLALLVACVTGVGESLMPAAPSISKEGLGGRQLWDALNDLLTPGHWFSSPRDGNYCRNRGSARFELRHVSGAGALYSVGFRSIQIVRL